MHIGLDDTDSKKGGCTTYLAALLIKELEQFKVHFIDYPLLIRLNPNVPWKTRGNGSLCLRFKYNVQYEEQIKETAINLWEEQSKFKEKGTDPGIVIYKSQTIPEELTAFSKKAETTIVKLKEALKLIKNVGAEAIGFNSCRGIIGALAAIGEILDADHTYELIAYRKQENIGTKRRVDEKSIFKMDEITAPYTFNNVDIEKNRIIITPRGPDPILFGIRGETANIVKEAFELVKTWEPIERWVIFRSNQGTDAHLKAIKDLSKITPYSSVIVKGIVSKNPRVIPVRHIIFSIKDDKKEVDCAAYEPTGNLRRIARELIVGDNLEVYGAIQKPKADKPWTINLEKIDVLNLAQKVTTENPLCPQCEKRLKSMGKNQGLRCEKCNNVFPNLKKIEKPVLRSVKNGLFITSTRSQRHLTKPFRRFGQEKKNYRNQSLISKWHSTSE